MTKARNHMATIHKSGGEKTLESCINHFQVQKKKFHLLRRFMKKSGLSVDEDYLVTAPDDVWDRLVEEEVR